MKKKCWKKFIFAVAMVTTSGASLDVEAHSQQEHAILTTTRTGRPRPGRGTRRHPKKRGLLLQDGAKRIMAPLSGGNPFHRRGGGKKMTTEGTSSFGASIFNLVNNVAGAGILALSAGQAKGTGWIPGVLICALLGTISARTFAMIGEACELTQQEDFKGLWGATMGERTTHLVDSTIATLCLACSVIYSGILGDVLTSLLTQFGLLSSKYNGRTSNIVAVTLTALLPLSLIKNLSALAFTSVLGFSAIMYTVLFITIRAVDGSYTLGAGQFVTGENALELLPAFTKTSWWKVDFSSLVLASNLGLAYIAHYNGPIFYRDLKDHSPKRFRKMVGTSFSILVLLYSLTMVAGYSTFGDNCQGNILLNYHPDDIWSTLGRFATFVSILFGFPLVVTGAREGIAGAASSMGWNWVGEEQNHVWLVSTILLVVTLIACAVPDVSVVVGLTGAAMGSFIVYICPVLIYAGAVKQAKGPASPEALAAKRYFVLIPFGILVGALGVFMTLSHSS